MEDPAQSFLCPPLEDDPPNTIFREPSLYNPMGTFRLPAGGARHYQQQYSDIYFLRLTRLKPAVSEVAKSAWEGYNIAGEYARRVDRVLDVRQGELSWVVGTVYMELPLKPSIMDDISKENWTAAPIPQKTYNDPNSTKPTQTMVEDESGRLVLTGSLLQSSFLVTGVVVAVLGTENADGEFEVVDIKVPDIPPQPERWEREEPSDGIPAKRKHSAFEGDDSRSGKGKKIAFVSGLGITGTSGDTVSLSLLADYLLGYTGSNPGDGDSISANPSQISRLVIAGNSLGAKTASTGDDAAGSENRQPKKYGYDASAYNASPITLLDTFLSDILPSIPVTLMPGETDPANFSLPQQEIHTAMLPQSKAYCAPIAPRREALLAEPGWLDSVTNPWEGDIEGWRFWGTSGQNVDDVLRYVDTEELEGEEDEDVQNGVRLRIMDYMLKWRCGVPTAPDTIWCYPFQDKDPFVIQSCPHVFFTGNQPHFQSSIIEGGDWGSGDDNITKVRLIALPKFHETGEIVLLDSETLAVEVVKFGTIEKASNAGKDEEMSDAS
ncbi:DNA polymerase delta small subunit Cdc1 [Microsporum canis]|uniref:DNA-directed DNA polymerase n=1 Tax=Arthroderma otae (strain ATCC MYA-4605 / CBS 113480) TaxID=554155 RepID=C5FWS7_ARTOC|nr:DNA polymerase subunit delta-2 [Microsporum canis CBS 113480]EEQ33334.1 DNA polymerase subunit delta-2 [Microsporum canis CBS 113480]